MAFRLPILAAATLCFTWVGPAIAQDASSAPGVRSTPAPTTAPARTAAAPRQVRVAFDGTPFNDAVDAFRDAIGVSVYVNWRRLEAEGIDTTTPISIRMGGITYGKLLSLMLESVSPRLRYTVHEGVITIYAIPESQVQTGPPMLTRVYDVTDLMWVLPDLDPAGGGAGRGGDARTGGTARDPSAARSGNTRRSR